MANKVSIFIENSDDSHIELSNSKMSIMMAKEYDANWNTVFPNEKIGLYDIVIYDMHKVYRSYGKGYVLVEHCEDEETAKYIITSCKNLLNKQFERMMEMRVMKKYGFLTSLTNLELEFHDSENYEISIKELKQKMKSQLLM